MKSQEVSLQNVRLHQTIIIITYIIHMYNVKSLAYDT